MSRIICHEPVLCFSGGHASELTGSGHVATFRMGFSEKRLKKREFSPNLKMSHFVFVFQSWELRF